MFTFSPSQLGGSKPVFVLEFEFGRSHRYSTDTISIKNEKGDVMDYLPNIIDFDFVESADVQSIDVEANLLSMALVIEDVDLLDRWSKGEVLDGVEATFSYVLEKYSISQIEDEKKVQLFRGKIQEPQFGDPDQIDGYVTFSVEILLDDGDRLLMDSNKYIDARFPDRHLDTADGKVWPIFFGTGQSPSYCIKRLSGGNAEFMICGHPILDTAVTIKDELTNTASKTVQKKADNQGNIYSYIQIASGDNISTPSSLGGYLHGESRQWWSTIEGGLRSPYRDGPLELGGDVCRWALSRSGLRIDDGAWANLSIVLNRFKFGGWINDPKPNALEWLQANILPFLPVSLIVGINGIKPIFNQLWALSLVSPVIEISIGAEEICQQIGMIDTLRATADLINEITVQYSKSGFDQDYTKLVRVTNIAVEDYDVPSEYSILSVNRFGKHPKTVSCDYVFDDATALLIASNLVRSNALPLYQIAMASPTELGWIQIGDVVSINIGRLRLSKQLALITKKQWSGSHWIFEVVFESNSIQGSKS
jgi:hypothetical protein